ncbi:Thioredoxin [Pseudozyma hubeiensis]|nr:Thioredoxin [Pseudozyma hubeiensis]
MTTPQATEDGEFPVKLFVYDLSRGMAKSMSMPLTGRQIDGIWHTSIVAFDREYFFGQGISIVYPGTSHHGAPIETFDLGTTSIDRETFEGALLPDLRDRFRPEDYNLLSWNCNNFTQEVAQILTGADIPAHIRSLPQDFLSTPFGQMLRPQIDAMFRAPSAAVAAPSAGAVNGLGGDLLNQVASRAYTGNTSVEQGSPSKATTSNPVHHVTNNTQLHEILSIFPCVAVLFTSESCPPCRIIKPAFTDLAHHHHVDESKPGNHKRIAFVQVDSNASTSSLFAQSSVIATPTVKLYTFGKESSQVRGADVGELKNAVDLMLFEVYPPHPHARLSKPLKALGAIPSQPHLYSSTPNLNSLLQKLDTVIAQHPAKSFAEKADLQVARKTIASGWIPWLETMRDSKGKKLAPSTLADESSKVAKQLSATFPLDAMFPILDLFRLSVLDDLFVRTAFRQPANADRKDINGITRLLSLVADLAFKAEWSTSQRPLLLTAARLLTNLAASVPFVEVIESHENVRSLTLELTTSLLLCPDATVRSAAATCAFNLALHQHAERAEWINRDPQAPPMLGSRLGETWESETASALLQAIINESESDETLHRLVAALTLHIHLSQFWQDSVGPMLQVLEARDAVADTRQGQLVTSSAKKQELSRLLDDLIVLLSSAETS